MQKKIINIQDLKLMSTRELQEYLKSLNLKMEINGKNQIIFEIMKFHVENNDVVHFSGIFEKIPNGNYGFLRDIRNNFIQCFYDIYINGKLITDYDLRIGDEILCTVEKPKEGKLLCAGNILSVNGRKAKNRPNYFEELTAIYPTEQIKLFNEKLHDKFNLINRIIDLLCPIGRGQRGLIVAPPKCGKTTMLHSIALGVTNNYPDFKLIILLVGERPEEVTEMKRTVPYAEILFSTFDEPAENHIKTVELIIERAKRLVEEGNNVVLLLDSITRLVRSYNHVVPSSGKVLTGGLEPESLQRAKRFFGNARNTEENVSLTIIATCLIETGSKMDDNICEEFKGTGNQDVKMDAKIANNRIFPAINVKESRTRNYEQLIPISQLSKIKIIEQFLANMDSVDALKFLINKISHTKNNDELIAQIQRI